MYFRPKLFIILLLSLCQCTLFTTKNKFYSDKELSMFEKTLNALDYGYGYDSEMEIHYIYSYSFSKDNFKKKENSFAKIVKEIGPDTVIGLYEKILKLTYVTDYMMDKYKIETKWKYYTFIKNDLYEPLETYQSLLKKYILLRSPSLKNILEMKKLSINKQIVKEYTEKNEVVDTF